MDLELKTIQPSTQLLSPSLDPQLPDWANPTEPARFDLEESPYNHHMGFDFNESLQVGGEWWCQEVSLGGELVKEQRAVEGKAAEEAQQEDTGELRRAIASSQSQQQKEDSSDLEDEGAECTLELKQLIQIVDFMIYHSARNQKELSHYLRDNHPAYQRTELIHVLVQKFRKLKKTKEELIKYCMRKAFKFIGEHHSSSARCGQKSGYLGNKALYLKKISGERSMNSKYLKQVFKEEGFCADYRSFLAEFPRIIREDNEKKVRIFANMVLKNAKNIHKVQMMRRVPWTQTILNKAKEIGNELIKYDPQQFSPSKS